MNTFFEKIPQPGGHDSSFRHSLQQLNKQLDEMNKRTAAFLTRNSQEGHDLDSGLLSPSEALLPSGPAFWQLYRTLRTDLRALEARVGLIEERIDNINDRLDDIEPHQNTPPDTPVSEIRTTSTQNDYITSRDRWIKVTAQQPPLASEQDMSCADESDIGYFDSSISNATASDLGTSDVIIFIARLKRASRSKRIVHTERFLRGTALRLFTLGYNNDGTNMYEFDDGRLNVEEFEDVLMALYRQKALGVMKAERYTTADLISGRSLIEDYAFKMIGLGRYLVVEDEAERKKTVHGMIMNGISLSAPSCVLDVEDDIPETLPELLARLVEIEGSSKRAQEGARTHAATDPSGHNWAGSTNDERGETDFTRRATGNDLPSRPRQGPLDRVTAKELSSTPVSINIAPVWSGSTNTCTGGLWRTVYGDAGNATPMHSPGRESPYSLAQWSGNAHRAGPSRYGYGYYGRSTSDAHLQPASRWPGLARSDPPTAYTYGFN